MHLFNLCFFIVLNVKYVKINLFFAVSHSSDEHIISLCLYVACCVYFILLLALDVKGHSCIVLNLVVLKLELTMLLAMTQKKKKKTLETLILVSSSHSNEGGVK